MRLTIFAIMFSVLQTLAVGVVAQQNTISLEAKDVSIVRIFSMIEKQTDLSFMFKDEYVSKFNKISISVENKDAEVVLKKLLNERGLDFVKDGKVIIVMPKKAKAVSKQEKNEIKGKVVDENGDPMPGVTIQIEGISMGTATNVDGTFKFELPIKKGNLIISFVGYQKQKIAFEVGKYITVKMKVERSSLDEVTVQAYGTTTRRKMTGSISSVKSEEIKGVPASNLAGLLQGKVAGMDITNITGAPGGGGTAITIRGYNSLDVEADRNFSNPLWVVDGVPMEAGTSKVTGTSMLAHLNPEFIESIDVLKDASAAAIYGSRAANGVILVTTKKGRKNQQAKMSVNISHSYSVLPELPDVTIGNAERQFLYNRTKNDMKTYYDKDLNQYRFPTSLRDSYDHKDSYNLYNGWYAADPYSNPNGVNPIGGMVQDSLNSFYNNANNFFPVYFEKGKVSNISLQCYGGTENVVYGIGAGFYNEDGILVGTGYKRIDANLNLKVYPRKNYYIDIRVNGSYGQRAKPSGGGGSVEVVPGNPYQQSTLLPGPGTDFWNRMLLTLNGVDEKNRDIRIMSTLKAGVKIIDGLEFTSSLSIDYSNGNTDRFTPSTMDKFNWSESRFNTSKQTMWMNENLLSYKTKINGTHEISSIAGFSYQYNQTQYYAGLGKNSPSDYIKYVSKEFPGLINIGTDDVPQWIPLKDFMSDMTEKGLMSYFTRLEYNYKSKYLFSASMRADGSSVFGKNNKWGYFPSVSGGWVFSEEDFMQWANWLNFAKLRFSWGKSGKHFSQPYLALGILEAGKPYLGETTIEPKWKDGLYNKDLSWEETDQIDLGFELDLFNYKLNITADYYLRNTSDLLFPVLLPGADVTGSSYNSYILQWRNAAEVSNSGIEFMIKYNPIRKKDLNWNITLNLSKNWNRLNSTYNDRDLTLNQHLIAGDLGANPNKIIGKKLSGIFGYQTDGYYQTDGEVPVYINANGMSYPISSFDQNKTYNFHAGDFRYIDQNEDGTISKEDEVYLGSALPEITGGISSDLRYKNFDLKMQFSYQLGRDMVNLAPLNSVVGTNPILLNLDEYSFWEKEGDIDPFFPVSQTDISLFKHLDYTDRYVEHVNWIKLKSVVLGYNLNKRIAKKLGLDNLRVFVSGENLFTITNYSGMDPETVDIRNGIDSGQNYPLARKFTLGLTVNF